MCKVKLPGISRCLPVSAFFLHSKKCFCSSSRRQTHAFSSFIVYGLCGGTALTGGKSREREREKECLGARKAIRKVERWNQGGGKWRRRMMMRYTISKLDNFQLTREINGASNYYYWIFVWNWLVRAFPILLWKMSKVLPSVINVDELIARLPTTRKIESQFEAILNMLG